MKLTWIIALLSCLVLAGCQSAGEVIATPTVTSQVKVATATLFPSPITEPTSTPAAILTATSKPPEICSPFAGDSLEELENAIVNPYLPPPPGIDRPHQGVDLAILEEDSNMALPGEEVYAILSGVVSMIIHDRFPYGNAILIETRLQSANNEIYYLEPLPTPWPEVKPDPALTCPIVEEKPLEHNQSSIYILYAHLLEPPVFEVGSPVKCGEAIGKIGMSGNAINPHVHIEARLGPANVSFESMAHYDSSASLLEMSTYCQWRVSGTFQHFDPMRLLERVSTSILP